MKRLFQLAVARVYADLYQVYMCLRHLEPYCVYETRDTRGHIRSIGVALMDKRETYRTFFGPHEPEVVSRIIANRRHYQKA